MFVDKVDHKNVAPVADGLFGLMVSNGSTNKVASACSA